MTDGILIRQGRQNILHWDYHKLFYQYSRHGKLIRKLLSTDVGIRHEQGFQDWTRETEDGNPGKGKWNTEDHSNVSNVKQQEVSAFECCLGWSEVCWAWTAAQFFPGNAYIFLSLQSKKRITSCSLYKTLLLVHPRIKKEPRGWSCVLEHIITCYTDANKYSRSTE